MEGPMLSSFLTLNYKKQTHFYETTLQSTYHLASHSHKALSNTKPFTLVLMWYLFLLILTILISMDIWTWYQKCSSWCHFICQKSPLFFPTFWIVQGLSLEVELLLNNQNLTNGCELFGWNIHVWTKIHQLS